MAKAKGSPKTGGRKKGSLNKIKLEVKEAIAAAFEEVGGKEYLVKLAREDPRTFCALVGKLVPVAQDVNMNVTQYDQMDEDELREHIEKQMHAIRLLDQSNGREH